MNLHVHAAADDIDRTVLEDSPDLAPIKHDACCTPETPQGECCAPKPELPAGAPCCGTRAPASTALRAELRAIDRLMGASAGALALAAPDDARARPPDPR